MATYFDFSLRLFTAIIIFTNFKFMQTINVELVFDLQEFFKSDLILIVIDNENYELIKKFHKIKNNEARGFIGVIDINKDFEKFAERKYLCPYRNTMVVLDGHVNIIDKIGKLNDLKLMAAVVWVHFNKNDFSKELQDLYIPINCRFLILKEINKFNYEIQDVYQISPNHSKIYSHFADWKNGELNVFVKEFYSNRMDLMGHTLTIAYSIYGEPFNNFWRLFSEKMNFSINWTYPILGSLYPNGTKTGSLKLIYEREADGSPSYMVYTRERSEVYEYIFPTLINEIKMYVKKDSAINWTSYLTPFNRDVWVSIFLYTILISWTKHLILKFKSFKIPGKFEGSFFSSLKGLVSQAGILNTSNTPLCILYLMPYVFAIIITQHYSGALSSYLSVTQINLPFKNLEEVVEDKSYKLSLVKGTYLTFFFSVDNGPLAKAIRKNNLLVESDKLPKGSGDGFPPLCNNRWIFLSTSLGVNIKENCEIAEINDVVYTESFGIIVWKGFPLRDVLTKLVRRLHLAGVEKLKKKNKIVKDKNSDAFKPFSMEVVFPIFLVYLFSCFMSVLILLAEVGWKKLQL